MQSDNSENVVTLICQKLQNFSQNSFEDNAITLSIVDKILCNKLSLPEMEFWEKFWSFWHMSVTTFSELSDGAEA
jgi:hypothetical protein